MGGLRKDRSAFAASAEIHGAIESAMGRGNAVDAVCTGMLLACALDETVAWGSASLVVAGFGMSPRRLDGRVLQPGNGARRPRGFRPEEEIPSAAFVPVPRLFAAIGTAVTLAGRATYTGSSAPAVASCANDARRALLQSFSALGPALFQNRSIAEEIRLSAGPGAKGALCAEDLAIAAPSFEDLAVLDEDIFASAAAGEIAYHESTLEWLGARDSSGLICFASIERASDGHRIEALGVVAPRSAVPVRRGVQWVDPTTPLGSLPPVRVEVRDGQIFAVEGLHGHTSALAAFERSAVRRTSADAVAAFPELGVVRMERA